MAIPTIVLLLSLGGSSNDLALDAFQYADSASAQKAWVSSPGATQVAVVQDDRRNVLEFAVPFAKEQELPRVYLDYKIKADLADEGFFDLEIWADHPRAVGNVTLFFRSGSGWYACNAGLANDGWQTLRFSRASYRTEGSPAGWDAIDGVRISCCRGQAIDTRIRLRRLSAGRHHIALVVPGARSGKADQEIRSANDVADRVGTMLDELGLGCDIVSESAVAKNALGKRRVAVLAYNPTIDDATVAGLLRFIENGGQVLSCYALPAELGKALGFGDVRYYKPEQAGGLAEIRFDADAASGLPKAVRQASWNIRTASPIAHQARVIGKWYDSHGQPTGHAAMLVSDRGAYFSHIILDDDREGKKQMLAAVLGKMAPQLWQEMRQRGIERCCQEQLGHCDNIRDAYRFIVQRKSTDALAKWGESVATYKESMQSKKPQEAIKLLRKTRALLVEAYLLSVPSVAREGRAWWNHSGTGAHDGDWERTAAELAEHGFNMVLPNMLWSGRAHYPSKVLPESETYRKHGDQIAQCVEAAHKHGIEVHVWKVNYNLSGAPKDFVERMQSEGRTQANNRGEPQKWLCPSHPENIKLELDSMIEVARNYEVDGLHFDYIRYPNRTCCYCDGCRERFEKSIGKKVTPWPDVCYDGPLQNRYHDWRCAQITRLVAAVHQEAKKVRPGIKISAAVFGRYPACRKSIGQDWLAWVKSGYLDFICPMDYTNQDAAFIGLVQTQIDLIDGRIPIYPGIGATASRSSLTPDRVVGQIHYARELGADGFTIFNLSQNTAETILRGVGLGATSEKAIPPHRGD